MSSERTNLRRSLRERARQYVAAMRVAKGLPADTPKDRLLITSLGTDVPAVGPVSSTGAGGDRGLVRVEDTACGKALTEMNLYGENSALTRPLADRVWREVHRRVSEQARGDVTVLASGAHPRSDFARVELPALLANPEVSTINGGDKAAAKALVRDEGGKPGDGGGRGGGESAFIGRMPRNRQTQR